MPRKSRTEHVTMPHGSRFYCGHCHEIYAMNVPCLIEVFVAAGMAYAKAHADCEPSPPPVLSTPEEWVRWVDIGNSSLTIWAVAMQRSPPWEYTPNPPKDPSDFGRCYRLLKLFPHMRPALDTVAARHPAWKPLVEHWSTLENLYVAELPKGELPRLYALMRELRGEPPEA